MKTTQTIAAETEAIVAHGVSEEQAKALAAISAEARERGFDGHLPVGNIGEWQFNLDEPGLDDLAERAQNIWRAIDVDGPARSRDAYQRTSGATLGMRRN